MKVCYSLATTDMEGGAQSLLDLIKFDLCNNVEPYLILSRHHVELEKKLKDMNVKYKIIFHGTDCLDENKIKLWIKKIVNFISVYRIMHYLKKEKIDILHNNSVLSLVGMKAAYKLQIPYVCHIREVIEEGLLLKMINYDDLYFYINNSFKYITISNFVKKNYINYVDTAKNVTFFDGIDTKKYENSARKIGKNINKILFVGRYSKVKGQKEAVYALNELINIKKLKVFMTFVGTIGEKDYYNDLIKYVKTHNLEKYVEFLTYTNDLKRIRNNYDVALICSLNEAMGRVTAEAMLSKQIVIGAKSGATKEIVCSGHTGFLYESGNYKELADIIASLSNTNKEQLQKIVDNAFNYAVSSFDINRQNKKVLDIYNSIIK